jgi:hypothetical protein
MLTDLLAPTRRHAAIAVLAAVLITLHLLVRFGLHSTDTVVGIFVSDLFLLATLVLGGLPWSWSWPARRFAGNSVPTCWPAFRS